MNNIANLLSEINTFLVKHNADKETIEFLLELKQKILEADEQRLANRKKTTELPLVEVLLRSVGKKAFISCYDKFKQASNGKVGNITNFMKECLGDGVSDNSARTKSSVGARIFREGLEIEALKNIIAAAKVEEETKDEARKILEKEGV